MLRRTLLAPPASPISCLAVAYAKAQGASLRLRQQLWAGQAGDSLHCSGDGAPATYKETS